ncbi:exopolysaccharide biosynthesis polyprenyl glycosylphosphotransferase [Sphingomonas tabacisoli]|uniref:Exopolysaccharide biosynthesis polyprenyl glycosylphosphotransferase n=1 Tax=Sphingomonas tabacisoli TaxID=2249466 RepID=A0ABW4I3T1_9SPHN
MLIANRTLKPWKVSEPVELPTIPDMEARRVKFYAVLTIVDAAAIALSFLLAGLVYLGDLLSVHSVTMLLVLAPLYLAFAASGGSYADAVLRSTNEGVIKALRSLALGGAAILLIAYTMKAGESFSRGVFWIGMISSAVVLTVGRICMTRILHRLLGRNLFSTVVICDDADYTAMPGDVVLQAGWLGFSADTDDPLDYHQLANIVAHADRVIVSCSRDRYGQWARVLKSMAVDGEIVTTDSDDLGLIGIGWHGRHRTLVVSAGPLHLRDRILKRAFDIAVSSIALLVLSPLMVAVAVAIRMESAGSVFFRQSRIGRDNKIFQMYKFRSMYIDACDSNATKLTTREDPRVTRVGELIRRNSIDELPQLINVLKGEMSIVGPRPHAISARAAELLYWEVDPRYRHRHSVKPGLTGLAQIRGFRGATDRTEDLKNRLSADLEYLNRWSLWQDILIVLRTFSVLRHDNAF